MSARPNILFIIADDHRFNAIRAFGDPTVQTPVLDRLAGGGAAFRKAHMMGGPLAAVCVPSRACLLTGANVFRASCSREVNDDENVKILDPDLALLPEVFRQAGYHTFATGKWHNDKQSFARGFCSGGPIFFGGMSDHLRVPVHDFDPEGIYPDESIHTGEKFSTELFTDTAVEFLQGYEEDDPFFLYLAFTSPHDPRMAPKEYADMYDPEAIPLPENFLPEHPFDNGELKIRDEELAPFPRTPDVVRRHIADYYAMITHHDAHIGRLMNALEESGRAENTLIVYTADHGLAVGQHGLMGKQNMYDHSVRIPQILHGPGIPRGKAIHALTYLYDLYPTLCDLAGIPIPGTVEGHSLVPMLTGEREGIRDSVCSVYKDLQRTVSDGRWKLIRYYRSGDAGTDRIQLFDVESDPWETRDLSEVPEQQERIRGLADKLAAWQAEVDDPLAGRRIIPD